MKASINSNALSQADRGPVLAVLAGYKDKPVDDWLPQNHPAKNGFLPRRWDQVSLIANNHLVEAVAAAAPNHCVDGWAYISRAISALLAGDLHAARHLAYYGQLRAGLSILGHLGVGIFNGINFAVKADGTVARLDVRGCLGTHSAVWMALKAWVSAPELAKQFLDLIKIGNASLTECLDAIWPSTSKTAVAGQLIAAWGLDLMRGESEHVARNMSSYNPQAFDSLPDNPLERMEFVESIWSCFEPTSLTKFDGLDRSLLRALLWQQHRLLDAGPIGEGAIAKRFEYLPEGVRRMAPLSFVTGETDPADPLILFHARKQTEPALPVEMIARGLLLLRAATAFTTTNFQDAGVSVDRGELRPWIDQVAVRRGYWEGNSPLDNPVDLWLDVEDALQDLAKSKEPAPTSLSAWMKRSPVGLPTISEAERIGVWSLSS